MEPTPREVIVYKTTIETVETRGPEAWVFSIFNITGLWFVSGQPNLTPGDRVRITITKEPPDERT